MKKTKTSKKTPKAKANARKTVAPKSKLAAKRKLAAKAKTSVKKSLKKTTPVVKAKAPARKKKRVVPTTQVGSQSVETMQLRAKSRVARAGAGGGDFGGASIVEGADSESADELLEEGQTFEAGIVRGVEEADDNIEQEVHTHEVPQDDVPDEYEDKDRP
jgi:hypothetical protein